jgi:hypothetical protein
VRKLDSAKLNDWIQIIGIFALVASLVFVGMEVQQERDLARSDLAAQSFANTSMFHLTLSSPDFAKTYAKVLESPNNLTIDEKLQIDGYLRAFVAMIRRECYLTERDVFSECRGIVQGIGPNVFGSKYAQAWWQLNKPDVGPYFPEWVDSAITSFDPDQNLQMLEQISVDR